MPERKICLLCGSHFPETQDPSRCPICEDERGLGFAPRNGQPFTTLQAFRSSHACVVQEEGPGLTGIGMEPFVFDRIHGGWFRTRVERDAKNIFARSVRRYLHALEA